MQLVLTLYYYSTIYYS